MSKVAATGICCLCGASMVPNALMQCASCIASETDILGKIPKSCTLSQCRGCSRWNKPPWAACEPESRELLAMCLKRIKGLGKDLRLVDASFVWTEEHSKRKMVKITVQKEVAAGSVLQQSLVVEFVVQNEQCEECQKSYTPHGFSAMVQVRQKAHNRRSLAHLEQLILKHKMHEKIVNLQAAPKGLDFHFATRSQAERLSDFVASRFPCKKSTARELISHDANSNIYHYKYTILCEMCPVCAGDVVAIPEKPVSVLNGAPPLLVCKKVGATLTLVDPQSENYYVIANEKYWEKPFTSLVSKQHLTEFIVFNVEPAADTQPKRRKKTPAREDDAQQRKHYDVERCSAIADIEVASTSNLEELVIVRSHLGRILKPGDRVLGYDFRSLSCVDSDVLNPDRRNERGTPDAILVKKPKFKKFAGKNVQPPMPEDLWSEDVANEVREPQNVTVDAGAADENVEAGYAKSDGSSDSDDSFDEPNAGGDDGYIGPLSAMMGSINLADDS